MTTFCSIDIRTSRQSNVTGFNQWLTKQRYTYIYFVQELFHKHTASYLTIIYTYIVIQVPSVEDHVQECLKKISELKLEEVSDKDKTEFKKRKLIAEM